jgi:hypothetical protein
VGEVERDKRKMTIKIMLKIKGRKQKDIGGKKMEKNTIKLERRNKI